MLDEAANTTNAILHRLTHGWKSPRGTVVRIEVLVAIAAILSFFLLFFGSWRRWCKHWSIQYGVLAAYTLSVSVVTYTMGSMQSSASTNEMFPIWALSLLAVIGGTNSITAYKLSDNKQYLSQLIQQFLMAGYVLLIAATVTNSIASVAFMLLFFDTQQKNVFRMLACWFACESWNPNKQVADYMELVDKPIKSAYNPVNMTGYPYLVSWRTQNMKLKAPCYKRKLVDKDAAVTIEKIWLCNHGLLALTDDDAGSKLKDVCLSFSLYQLLKRCYFGFHCYESGQKKTHDFIFKGLLLDEKEGYERAFRVIEVELGFLYDFFYTKYAVIHFIGNPFLIWGLFSVACICFIGAVTAMRKFRTGGSSDGIIIVDTNAADIVITLTVLVCLILLQVLQVILYWASNWGKVALVCDYVRRPSLKGCASCVMKIKEFLSGFSLFEKYYWQHKLGQYSLLESYAYNSGKRRTKPSGRTSALERRIKKSPFYGSLKGNSIKGRVESKATKLSPQVSKEVIDTLLRNYQPTNDYLNSSLLSTKVPGNISLTFIDGDTHIHTILVWHIATCYCEIASTKIQADEAPEVMEKHRDVAKELSKYCAYLVVFAPKLLPGHHWDTSELFNAAVKEARRFLKGADDKYEAMNKLEGSTETIFQRGVLLGRKLEREYDVAQRWKVMAHFWTEMILYIAPSGDVEAHVEHLAKGGEFITHLWALLFHAGIVKLGKAPKREEPEQKQHEEEGEDHIEVFCSS